MRLYLHMCVCMCEYMYTHIHAYMCIYMHTHLCPNFPQRYMRIFALIHVNEWGISFSMPQSHLLPALPHLFSGTPSSQAVLPCPSSHRVALSKWRSREGCSLTQLPAQSWLNVLFPIRVISPVASKLPREKEQRSGVYRMSVFKVTLCVSHFFFF